MLLVALLMLLSLSEDGVLVMEMAGVSPFHLASSLENISSSLRYLELELDRGVTVSTCLGRVSESVRLADEAAEDEAEVWVVAAAAAAFLAWPEAALVSDSLAELEPEPEPLEVSQLEPELVPDDVEGSLPDDTPDEKPESRPSAPLGESRGRLVDTCSPGIWETLAGMPRCVWWCRWVTMFVTVSVSVSCVSLLVGNLSLKNCRALMRWQEMSCVVLCCSLLCRLFRLCCFPRGDEDEECKSREVEEDVSEKSCVCVSLSLLSCLWCLSLPSRVL